MFESDAQMAALTAVFLDDEGATGFIEEFWGITVRGKNLKGARKQLKEAAQAFLDENRDDILRRMDSDGPVTARGCCWRFRGTVFSPCVSARSSEQPPPQASENVAVWCRLKERVHGRTTGSEGDATRSR